MDRALASLHSATAKLLTCWHLGNPRQSHPADARIRMTGLVIHVPRRVCRSSDVPTRHLEADTPDPEAQVRPKRTAHPESHSALAKRFGKCVHVDPRSLDHTTSKFSIIPPSSCSRRWQCSR